MQSSISKNKTMLFTVLIIFLIITLGKFVFYNAIGKLIKEFFLMFN